MKSYLYRAGPDMSENGPVREDEVVIVVMIWLDHHLRIQRRQFRESSAKEFFRGQRLTRAQAMLHRRWRGTRSRTTSTGHIWPPYRTQGLIWHTPWRTRQAVTDRGTEWLTRLIPNYLNNSYHNSLILSTCSLNLWPSVIVDRFITRGLIGSAFYY